MADYYVEELRESIRRGSVREWEVHKDYEVVDGVLRPIGKPRWVYFPMVHPEIVGEIGKLYEGDEGRLVTFAQTWGLLGGSSTPGEEGDPLAWVWAHASNIRMALELQYYLQGGDHEELDEEGLDQFLNSHQRPFPPGFEQEFADLAAKATSRVEAFRSVERVMMLPDVEIRAWFSYDGADPVGTARRVIAGIVNLELSEMMYVLLCRQIGPVSEADLRLFLTFRSLVTVAYWHLAHVIGGSGRLGRCQDPRCGALFVETDRRQHFCPRPPKWKAKTGSLCGARLRKRKKGQRKGD